MAKIWSFIMVTHVNDGQSKWKINFTRYYFRVLRNIFEHHLPIIWRALHDETTIFCDSQHTREIFNHFIVFNLHLKFVDFQRGWPMEMSYFDMKFKNFQINYYLTCMLEIAKKSSFISVISVNNGQMNWKINFTRYCSSVYWNIVFIHFAIIWRA